MSHTDPGVTGRRPVNSPVGRKRKQTRKRVRPPSETMSIPEAGRKYYGLSKNGSYDAAERGEIPYVQIGRLKRVPVKLMEEQVNNLALAKMEEKQRKAAAA